MEKDAPFFQTVLDHLDDRDEWNKKDTEIQKRRLGERPRRRNNPYPGAPNFVDQIIDDMVSMKTDQERSMIANAPSIAVMIPKGGKAAPAGVVTQAQRTFDTFLRHVIKFMPKCEEAIDTKNARGFAVTLGVRVDHPDYGPIPDFEILDPKDLIVPWNTKWTKLPDADGLTYVRRYSKREFSGKAKDGWKNTERVLEQLRQSSEQDQEGVTQSAYDDENTSSERATAKLVGVSASSVADNKIVVWCYLCYATKWIVQRAKNPEVVEGRKCMAYICPDVPDLLLYARPWKRPDVPAETRPMDMTERVMENIAALREGRDPVYEVVLKPMVPGKDKPWPINQHRYEMRTSLWYDSRGLGHLLMDNQIMATGIRNAQAVWLDFSKNFLFEGDGSNDLNVTNIKVKPGSILPRGITAATLPQPPGNFDFLMDRERRMASTRAGAGAYNYSAAVQSSRKLEKTATEIQDQSAKESTVTSASVDRFNEPYRELFQMLWDDLRELRPILPMMDGTEFLGMADQSIYDYDFLVVPAASGRTLNPELQYMKNKDLFAFGASLAQAGVPVDLREGAVYVAANANPDMARVLFPDPKKMNAPNQLPINTQLDQIRELLKQIVGSGKSLEEGLQATQKLAVEHDDKLAAMEGVINGVEQEFARAGIKLAAPQQAPQRAPGRPARIG